MSMASTVPPSPAPFRPRYVADVLADWGIPPERMLMDPPPGTATEADLVAWNERQDWNGLCELVAGTLVEKPMGFPEGHVAAQLIFLVQLFLEDHRIGILAGPDAPTRFAPDQIRLPDVTFVALARLPGGMIPRDAVSRIPPNLVVEILSPSNTRAEMAQKRTEYFAAGVELVWQVDPDTRSAEVYTSPTAVTAVPPDGSLDGGTVLPGLSIPLARLFAGFDPPPAP